MKRHRSGIDPFELFSAYHLGLARDGSAGIRNIHQVAAQFATNAGVLREALTFYAMEPEQVVNSGFDVPGAQADIAVAESSEERRQLAQAAYAAFREADPHGRDWRRELDEDRGALSEDPLFGRKK